MYLKLTSFVSNFPVFYNRSLPFSCYFFTSDLTFSNENIESDVLTFRAELKKRDNKSLPDSLP